MWCQYTLDAELHTRGLPRILVCFDRLLRYPAQEMSRIGDVLATPLSALPSAEVADFVSPSLRHHVDCAPDSSVNSQLAEFCARFTGDLHKLAAASPQEWSDTALAMTCDAARQCFRGRYPALLPELSAALLSRFVTERRAADDARRQSVQAFQDRAFFEARVDERDSRLGHLETQIAGLRTSLAAAQAASIASEHQNEILRQRLSDLVDIAHDRLAQIETQEALLNETRHVSEQWQLKCERAFGALDAAHPSTSWRVTAPLRYLAGMLRHHRSSGSNGTAASGTRRQPGSAGPKVVELIPGLLRQDPSAVACRGGRHDALSTASMIFPQDCSRTSVGSIWRPVF